MASPRDKSAVLRPRVRPAPCARRDSESLQETGSARLRRQWTEKWRAFFRARRAVRSNRALLRHRPSPSSVRDEATHSAEGDEAGPQIGGRKTARATLRARL